MVAAVPDAVDKTAGGLHGARRPPHPEGLAVGSWPYWCIDMGLGALVPAADAVGPIDQVVKGVRREVTRAGDADGGRHAGRIGCAGPEDHRKGERVVEAAVCGEQGKGIQAEEEAGAHDACAHRERLLAADEARHEHKGRDDLRQRGGGSGRGASGAERSRSSVEPPLSGGGGGVGG